MKNHRFGFVDRELFVFLILLAISLFITYETLGYSERVRRVPILFSSALTVLIALKVVLLVLNNATGLFDHVQEQQDADTFDWGQEEIEVGTTRQLRMAAWLLIPLSLIYLFGYIVAIPTFMFAFISIESDLSLRQNLLTTIVTTVVIYLFFVELLSMRMYEGLYGPSLPLF
jgi:cytosine/uracil/thiamine/allantoin permease